MAPKDRWFFQRGVLWLANLRNLNSIPVEAHVPTKFSRLEGDALPRLMTTVSQMDPISPAAIARRFDAGSWCFAAWVGGSIAAYGWVTRGPEYVGEFERQLRIREDEAYIWDCATLPNYRRQRLFTSLLGYITRQLQREGNQQAWIIGLTAALEINSGVAEIGFQPLLRLTYLRVVNKRMLVLTPVQDATAEQLDSARRLLKAKGEQEFGRLLVGNSVRPQPPATHYAG